MDCSYFRTHVCRSCSLLESDYQSILIARDAVVGELFPDSQILPCVPMERTAGSRIRGKLAVAGITDDPLIGFFAESQQFTAVDQCPLHHPLINQFAALLPKLIRDYRLTPYVPSTDSGELKFVVVTCSPAPGLSTPGLQSSGNPSAGELMVQFVLRSKEAVDRIRKAWIAGDLNHGGPVGVVSVSIQPERSSKISGEIDIPISDQIWLPLRFDDVELLYGPGSFLQTNYEMADKLYRAARNLLIEHQAAAVLDLYCGAGAFSLAAAPATATTLGVDVSADAIAAARESARRAHRTNAQFLCRNLSNATDNDLMSSGFDVVVCNPPRRGLDGASLHWIRSVCPRLLLYSSCNVATLKRDADLLAADFRMVRLQAFDMFPWTSHFEVLALMESIRGNGK
jgi:23S rRNA (uracil747-C5)-methyltransferase